MDRDVDDLGDLPPYGSRRGARTTHRRGRMTDAKRATIDRLAPEWMLSSAADLHGVGLLDIGVGNGTATLAWAEQHPGSLAVAVELHQPGIVALLQELEAEATPNVRVIEADAEVVLAELAPGSVDHVRVLFPDPWPKKRHVKRRLVNAAFVRGVARLLPVGGSLHLATDWVEYADQMRAAIDAEPSFQPVVDIEGEPAVDASGAPLDAPARWRTG